jgi:hypothetical protein
MIGSLKATVHRTYDLRVAKLQISELSDQSLIIFGTGMSSYQIQEFVIGLVPQLVQLFFLQQGRSQFCHLLL